jgi:hypothetical protein
VSIGDGNCIERLQSTGSAASVNAANREDVTRATRFGNAGRDAGA